MVATEWQWCTCVDRGVGEPHAEGCPFQGKERLITINDVLGRRFAEAEVAAKAKARHENEIERMAQAIHDADALRPWEDLTGEQRQHYRGLAKAARKAMDPPGGGKGNQ